MNAHEPGHPDVSAQPSLVGTTRLRDVATGTLTTVDAWVRTCVTEQGRDRAICLEALTNAVARGDVRIEDEG